MSIHKEIKRITTHTLQEMKDRGEKIAMLTSYDFSMATIVDDAGIDVILVGDSASNVMAGHETTLPITLDQMIYHASSVVRAIERCLVVVDLPFGSYQGNSKNALDSAIRIMKESGGHAVKLEGGSEISESITRILTAGIPVMGHLGLLPQTAEKYSVQAKKSEDAINLIQDAKILEESGAFSIVLEMVTSDVTEIITKSVKVPTIGIGSGINCDGQVLVVHDMLGMFEKIKPKFAKRYLNLSEEIRNAVNSYVNDVKEKRFPEKEHTFSMEKDELEKLEKKIV